MIKETDLYDSIIEIWTDREKSLRKDKVGRELFKTLLNGVYKKIKYQGDIL